MCYWKQWKKIKTRHDNLVKLGIDYFNAWEYANTRKGYWRISNSPILTLTFTNKRLIKKRREEKGLTQTNLALLLDITQIYVSQFETGGLVPSKNQIKKIAEILGLDKETFNKDLSQFYQAKKKELKKRIEEGQGNTEI